MNLITIVAKTHDKKKKRIGGEAVLHPCLLIVPGNCTEELLPRLPSTPSLLHPLSSLSLSFVTIFQTRSAEASLDPRLETTDDSGE